MNGWTVSTHTKNIEEKLPLWHTENLFILYLWAHSFCLLHINFGQIEFFFFESTNRIDIQSFFLWAYFVTQKLWYIEFWLQYSIDLHLSKAFDCEWMLVFSCQNTWIIMVYGATMMTYWMVVFREAMKYTKRHYITCTNHTKLLGNVAINILNKNFYMSSDLVGCLALSLLQLELQIKSVNKGF